MNGFENEFDSRKAEERRLKQELENKELEFQAQESARQEKARQTERIRLLSSTSVHEALGDGGTIALEFLEFMKKIQFPDADSLRIIKGTRQEHASLFDAILSRHPKTVDATPYVHGYRIGRRAVSSSSHWGMSGTTRIMLCEDGMVREDQVRGYITEPPAGNLDGPGFEIGLYDHTEYTYVPTRGDYYEQVAYQAFSQLSLEETLHTIAENATRPSITRREAMRVRQRD